MAAAAMRRWSVVFIAAAAAISTAPPIVAQPAREPTRVIFDTDMWGDMDDALALAMLHALEDRGEAKLLAVTTSTAAPSTATFIDVLNTFYAHDDIPIGLVRNGVTAQQIVTRFPIYGSTKGYTETLTGAVKPDGSFVFPRAMKDGGSAPDAVALLRKTLAAQSDASVVIIQVGFCTNLARLLESKADASSRLDGTELVKRKVRLLSVMAGSYADRDGRALEKSEPEFNVILDVPSARALFDRWPTPLVASGFEIGASMRIKGSSIERYYGYTENHPVLASYRFADTMFFRKKETPPGTLHDHATFDLTSVLYAIRPEDGYFDVSAPGKISVAADGASRFVARADGTHRYLTINDTQRARTLEAMTLLATAPPRKNSNGGHQPP